MIAEILNDYRKIEDNIDRIIEVSGYKLSYIYENLGLDRTSFYYKRKNKKFSSEEIYRLLEIIDIDKIEDKILGEMSIEGEKSETMTRAETEVILWN